MEFDGVIEMYRRSINNYSIKYNAFIGDGNSSAYSAIDREGTSSVAAFVRKEKCVNHLTKSTGTNMKRLVKDYKEKKPGRRQGS